VRTSCCSREVHLNAKRLFLQPPDYARGKTKRLNSCQICRRDVPYSAMRDVDLHVTPRLPQLHALPKGRLRLNCTIDSNEINCEFGRRVARYCGPTSRAGVGPYPRQERSLRAGFRFVFCATSHTPSSFERSRVLKHCVCIRTICTRRNKPARETRLTAGTPSVRDSTSGRSARDVVRLAKGDADEALHVGRERAPPPARTE
jgi:hypothetical protein